jgi:hypothetical protein
MAAIYIKHPQARFYVASNRVFIREALIDYLPAGIAYGMHIEGERNSLEGVRIALAEWYLLSQCSLLIHTHGSSFAIEASHVNIRPLLSVGC